jgi:hypothetical protein
MILGMSTFTFVHTLISLAALVLGIVVVIGLIRGRLLPVWTELYLATAVATSATGFGFPFDRFLPSHWIGVLSLALLAIAITARYRLHFAGAWRWIYAVSVVITVYFLVFVTIVQAFLKVPALHAVAPTQAEPPFVFAQFSALLAFLALTITVVLRFRPQPAVLASPQG